MVDFRELYSEEVLKQMNKLTFEDIDRALTAIEISIFQPRKEVQVWFCSNERDTL